MVSQIYYPSFKINHLLRETFIAYGDSQTSSLVLGYHRVGRYPTQTTQSLLSTARMIIPGPRDPQVENLRPQEENPRQGKQLLIERLGTR